MRFCFVSTRRGSYFMTELLSAISMATAAIGHTVELVFDEFPHLDREAIYVVIPHEFHAWGNPSGFPDARQRARTIALCTENPGTEWFEATYQLVREFGAAVSINRSSAAELEHRGIRCERLQLGYAPGWDTWLGDEDVERPIDVLYLGAADARRDPLLAGLGRDLWRRQSQLLVPPLEPRTRPRPDFLTGEEKYHRLRASRVLLNLHRTTSSALEWMRFLEAICNGCVVVSEPCVDNEPLVPGEHFLAAGAEGIADVINGLLDDRDRLAELRGGAYDFVRRELSMNAAADRLAELAAELPRQPSPTAKLRFSPDAHTAPAPPDESRPAQTPAQDGRPADERPTVDGLQPPGASQTSIGGHGAGGLLRRLSRRIAITGRDADVEVIAQSAAFERSAPRVSVVSVIAPGRERGDVEALATVAASDYGRLEILILDDVSTHGTGAAIRRFVDDHPSLATMLVRQRIDRGLAHSRNILAERARGEYVFMLAEEGGIYPSTLERLVQTLDADERALFSYPMVAAFDGERPVDLLSSLPWEPQRMRSGNCIDGMALIRRARLLELGGYSTDPRLRGWEDFYLWCRCAQAGAHGVHVPQVLAWRQQTASSETPEKWALMRELFPELLVAGSEREASRA
jgi:CTP:molybdopterin cytidylyltransferase MocA